MDPRKYEPKEQDNMKFLCFFSNVCFMNLRPANIPRLPVAKIILPVSKQNPLKNRKIGQYFAMKCQSLKIP